ncbi:substrate-binding periplasmic protein [Janthinobacterium sp. RB2R34]|uniref:substrate-binding periplasmic protein n=1 Tax=Janthinobacterium sp. RB2R34 TaxID=3424193 RepID=UPI003F26B63C
MESNLVMDSVEQGRRKVTAAAAILALLGLVWMGGAGAQGEPAAAAPRLMLVTEEFEPFNYLEQGKLTGYSVEVARALVERAGIAYSIAAYPWARAYSMAQQLPNVLIFSLARTPAREKQFQWIAPLARRQVYLYQLSKRNDIEVRSLADLPHYITSVNRDDIAHTQLAAMGLAQQGRLDLSNNALSGMNKLLAGRVDLIVGNPHSIRGLCASAGVPESAVRRTILLSDDSDYYVAASLGTPAATVERLREQYRVLRGSPFLHQLAARYHVALR